MYQLDDCISVDAANMVESWLTPMYSDAAYLNSICFTVQSYFDESLGRTRSLASRQTDHMHYAKSINMLQARLASGNKAEMLSESTLMTVLCMLGHAYMNDDLKTADHHNQGLLKLVMMKGISSVIHNTRLCVEIIR